MQFFLKDFRKRKRLINSITGNKYNCTSLYSYLIYLLDLMCSRNPKKHIRVNIVDHSLLKRHNISKRTFYERVVPALEDWGIIRVSKPREDDVCARYEVNVRRLLEVTEMTLDRLSLTEPSTFYSSYYLYLSILLSYLSPILPSYLPIIREQNGQEKTFEDWESLMTEFIYIIEGLAPEQDCWECYRQYEPEESDRIKWIIDAIDGNYKFKSTLYFSTKLKITPKEEKIIGRRYQAQMFNSPLIRGIHKETELIRQYKKNIACEYGYKVKSTKTGYLVALTGRQVDYDYALEKKIQRKKELQKLGMTGEFDLHSAIFAVVRLMNTGMFDVDWDIKSELEKNNYFYWDGTVLERSDFKRDDRLLYRIFFDGNEKAWDGYKKLKRVQKLSKSEFDRLYMDLLRIVGDMKKYERSVFLYESLLELKVQRKLLDKGCKVGTAYDCFYFDPTEISEEEVKAIITDSAYEMYNETK